MSPADRGSRLHPRAARLRGSPARRPGLARNDLARAGHPAIGTHGVLRGRARAPRARGAHLSMLLHAGGHSCGAFRTAGGRAGPPGLSGYLPRPCDGRPSRGGRAPAGPDARPGISVGRAAPVRGDGRGPWRSPPGRWSAAYGRCRGCGSRTKDIGVAYHLSVVVDDARQQISHVVRGEDLWDATPLHRVLIALLGLPVPEWHHHRLVRDEEGRRLAKRDNARALRTLREAGARPSDIRRQLGFR